MQSEKNEKGGQGRIIPKSKCSGLVQFEEKESVEKALKFSGEIGLHEKLITFERSHQAAVSIVPPGMHRIRPKGQGKKSKQNMKRKERRVAASNAAAQAETGDETGDSTQTKIKGDCVQIGKVSPSKSTKRSSALSFRPRNVGRQKHQPK